MGDVAEERESKGGEPEPPKMKANDNPWYLLATLYGEQPEKGDRELWARNRVAWNRYYAERLDKNARDNLIKDKGYSEDELTPFSQEELAGIAQSFAKRSSLAANIELPQNTQTIKWCNVKFDQGVIFDRYLFFNCEYVESIFSKATFVNVTFFGWIYFTKAKFSDFTNFAGATFAGFTDFYEAHFEETVWFTRATFSHVEKAIFHGARFEGEASFEGAIFTNGVLFDHLTFANVSFLSATFLNEARFDGAIFERESKFVNAKMNDMTSFEGTTFKEEPPKFFGAELHEGTVWPGRKAWPIPKRKDEAGNFIRAYERLKLEMDRLKKHEDELDFFALEMQSRRVLLGPWRGLPIALYGALSDYGRSYVRPLYALFAVAAMGTLVLLLSGAVAPWQSLGLAIANTFNVFGFRKDFIDPANVDIIKLPVLLKILAAAQTILGTILLFLFGLGIRNKFRMK